MTNVGFVIVVLAALTANVHCVSYGDIQMCEVQYVKPGDDFQMACRSDHASATRIYLPTETVPTEEALLEQGGGEQGHYAERSTTINEYEDATLGVDDGIYTCVVQHGADYDPIYSVAECRVIIVDLCVEAGCDDVEVCEADYDAGTAECTCNYECPNVLDILCSDTCEVFWNECTMEEKVCVDKVARQRESDGFCPNREAPVFRDIDEDIVVSYGEEITLASGLVKDGTPWATVHWVFHPADGSSPHYLSVRDLYELTVSPDTLGVYKITLMHCMDAEHAVRNEYRLALLIEPTTPPPTTSPPPTTVDPGESNFPSHVCTAFPGGVIEDFNSHPNYYDLSCTHILAADLMPAGSFYNPWFIYGTFDQLDGATSLMSMTFYHGSNIFEVQRGWLVITPDGSKAELEEGVPLQLGATGCSVTFKEWHVHVFCAEFSAYYDGLMTGHVQLRGEAGPWELEKGPTNIGLCFDDQSGWRPNWQVGNQRDQCEVDVDKEPCGDHSGDCGAYITSEQIPDHSWTRCGYGTDAACAELNCGDTVASQTQQCVLKQANSANCELKQGGDVVGSGDHCPEDECEWFALVVSRGCPQDHLPFDCS